MSTPLPQHCPSPRELDDLELLTTGALAPLVVFNAPGSPVTLSLPDELAGADRVELVDPEGLPLATYDAATGEVASLTHAQHGPFRSLRLTPAQSRERYAGRTVVPVAGPLTTDELDELAALGPVLLLALAGHGTGELSPVALVRATTAAARLLPDAEVVVVPLAAHDDPEADHALGAQVVATYAGGDPVHALGTSTSEAETYPEPIAEIIDFDRPAPEEQGLVLFFTGLSGSGKSTLAQALMDRLLERGGRTVTSLDGDVVRRNLSKGLTFSKEDRETNIRRIGWVAAEIARHGGVAVCSPIAPFAETRAQVREMVEEAGGAFFLVHVATPLEECERRDRKGLYAKARRGEIPEFTGISSPYEEPDDAAVRVDTTGRTIEDALGDVVDELAATGHLDLRDGVDAGAGDVAEEPLDVLFVCTANICRSPYMEHVARSLVDDAAGDGASLSFTSAGIQGFVDEPMDETMAATLPGGADGFRSRRLSAAMVEQADLLLTADAGHRAAVLEEHPAAVRKTFTLGQFAAAAEAADPALHGRDLIAVVGEQRPAADPEHDIADPYRRGADAAQEAAGRISTMLSVIVKRLQGA